MTLTPEMEAARERVKKNNAEKALLNSVEMTLTREEELWLAMVANQYEVETALRILRSIYPRSVPLSSAIWRLERIRWSV